MKTMRTAVLFVMLVLGLGLQGCATVAGPFNGLGSDEMSMLLVYRVDGLPVTGENYRAVAAAAQEMGVIISPQLSSAAEAGATSGLAYGNAYAAGGAAQGLFFGPVGAAAGAAVGGISGALGGVITGVTTAAFANVHAIAKAVDDRLTYLRTEGRVNHLAFVRVTGAFIRSRNNIGSPAPSLREKMPDWSGPPAGTPVQQKK
ncbi:MAG: hypothetical protein Q8R92_11895 [Deltaproteobacteria bacterium]|nr:hypothetical protein [Deltaproteobacteria bacterium]